jgi:oligo-1,6-glucosidase
MFIDWGEEGKFDPVDIPLPKLKEYYTRWNRVFNQGGWITSFLDNHDFPRMVSRFGNDSSYRIESAKLLATLILTMPGTPCIYFGSEIGMTNVAFDTIEDYRDVETLNFFKIFMEKGVPEREFLKIVHKVGRDNVRTPMQWNDQVNAGFSEGVPWIKLNPNFKTINVEKDSGSEKSIIKYYQKLIHLRKNEPCLVYGNYLDMHPQHPDIFYFRRSLENTTIDIVLNFSSKSIDFSEFFSLKNSTQLVSNYGDTFHPNEVRAWEACIIQTSC